MGRTGQGVTGLLRQDCTIHADETARIRQVDNNRVDNKRSEP